MNIDKAEVLRYLGHRGQAVDAGLDALIDEAIAECLALAKPLFTYRFFPVAVDGDKQLVSLAGTALSLSGVSITQHLRTATSACLLATSLGPGPENAIRRYQRTAPTRAVILDAAAADCVEKLCDRAEEDIRREAAQQGLKGNFRFSPGYGDLPLDVQPLLLAALDAGRRIGLTCTASNILVPRKSVTAVIGFSPEMERERPAKCQNCNMRDNCPYAEHKRGEEGATCGPGHTSAD